MPKETKEIYKLSPITRPEIQVDYIAERLDELTQIVKRIEEKLNTDDTGAGG